MNDTANATSDILKTPLPWQMSQWLQLSRALASGKFAHAYLLSGSEGLGKSHFANGFASYALCMNPMKQGDNGDHEQVKVSCGVCANCLKGGAGNHPDIFRLGLEEGSKNIKIDQVRLLSEFVIRSSHSGGVKLAIIQDAHLLNGSAANALLKTLEEPNEQTHLLLVSDHPGRLVATIRSRCQKLAFQIPGTEVAVPWLQSILGGVNVGTLLEASGMRPLIALEMAEGDSLQARSQLLESICDLKTGRKSIQQVLTLTAKIGESDVLQHFSAFLSKLTKYSLVAKEESEQGSDLQGLYALLKPSPDITLAHKVSCSLALFYTEVETARKQLASGSNPNPQLVMESILWRWSKLNLG